MKAIGKETNLATNVRDHVISGDKFGLHTAIRCEMSNSQVKAGTVIGRLANLVKCGRMQMRHMR